MIRKKFDLDSNGAGTIASCGEIQLCLAETFRENIHNHPSAAGLPVN